MDKRLGRHYYSPAIPRRVQYGQQIQFNSTHLYIYHVILNTLHCTATRATS